jgi:hypothetical protein
MKTPRRSIDDAIPSVPIFNIRKRPNVSIVLNVIELKMIDRDQRTTSVVGTLYKIKFSRKRAR